MDNRVQERVVALRTPLETLIDLRGLTLMAPERIA